MREVDSRIAKFDAISTIIYTTKYNITAVSSLLAANFTLYTAASTASTASTASGPGSSDEEGEVGVEPGDRGGRLPRAGLQLQLLLPGGGVRGLELHPGPGAEQGQQRDQPRLLQLGRHHGQLPRQDRAVHLHTADRQVAAGAAGVYTAGVSRDKLKLLSLEQHIRDQELSSHQHQPGHCAVCRNILEHGDTDTQAAETLSLSSPPPPPRVRPGSSHYLTRTVTW